jgi:hypothetical protein
MFIVDFIEGCISSRSVVSSGYSVLYASSNGLIEVAPDSTRNVTLPFMTAEQWQQYAKSATLNLRVMPAIAAFWRSRYIIMPPGTVEALVVQFVGQGVELWTYAFDQPVAALFVDDATGALYASYVAGSSAVVEVEPIDDPDTANLAKEYIWQSKRYRLPRETNLSWMQVYGRGLSSGFTLQATVVHYQQGDSGIVSHSRTYTVTSNKPMRLQQGFIGEEVQITLTGNAEIDHVILGESIEELSQA